MLSDWTEHLSQSFSLSFRSIVTCRLDFWIQLKAISGSAVFACISIVFVLGWEGPAWPRPLSEILAWVDGHWLSINIQALWHHLCCSHIRNSIIISQNKSFYATPTCGRIIILFVRLQQHNDIFKSAPLFRH